MRHFVFILFCLLCSFSSVASLQTEVVAGMLERIDSGLSAKMLLEIDADSIGGDWFELSQEDIRPKITANSPLSLAAGVGWYMKYVANHQLCWTDMRAAMPDTLPAVAEPVRMSTDLSLRYYLNYCTHSYSMAFWDWERWEREVDWMALHGINMPLAVTGTDVLWRNVLRRLGYSEERITSFIAGPGFQAWWLMNNLEGWGGPVSDEWLERQLELERRILDRMRAFGMKPVLAGYSGMVPHDARETLGLDVADPGLWLGYTRPAFLQPSDKDFSRVAEVYYDELRRLYGPVDYFSMDPFHEGGDVSRVNLEEAGKAIMAAMKQANPQAAWVIQCWGGNPRPQMIDSLPKGDILVLDLHAEAHPQWSTRGFSGHDWLYCMLHNFGGNIGLYGRMPSIAEGFAAACEDGSLRGVGLTMEGIETNPVLYELMSELPWRGGVVNLDEWIRGYAKARYGVSDPQVEEAWRLLMRSVYSCPQGNPQQGTAESVFCARPSDNPVNASTWACYTPYYDPEDVSRAAHLLVDHAPAFADNLSYIYDMVDVTRQAVADRGRRVAAKISDALGRGDSVAYRRESDRFLRLIELQDTLLGTVSDFRLGRWLEMARNSAATPADKALNEWNARVQITTWGGREPSDRGGLHDYSNREWQGLLRDFYLPRWQRWFEARLQNWNTRTQPEINFYEMESEWTRRTNHYDPAPQADPIRTARQVLTEALAPD